jgi:hypothetical protein
MTSGRLATKPSPTGVGYNRDRRCRQLHTLPREPSCRCLDFADDHRAVLASYRLYAGVLYAGVRLARARLGTRRAPVYGRF